MKKIYFLPLVFFSLMVFSQTNLKSYGFYSINFDSCELRIYRDNKTFEIGTPSYSFEDMFFCYEPFSKGSVSFEKNLIQCYDPTLKRRYDFLKVGDSLLIATKHTAVFVKGDTLRKVGD
jgi:hypothetical protein